MIKPIERVAVFIILINIGVWIYGYHEKLHTTSIISGVFSLLIGYLIIYSILSIILHKYAKELLNITTDYFKENHHLKKIEFSNNFYQEIERYFTSLILIMLLILDCFALFKYKFSVLSVVNSFVSSYGNE